MPKAPGKLSALLALGIGHWALTVSCGGGERVQYLSVATGPTGGVYYAYGGGLAKIYSEHLPGVQVTAEATAASVDNLKLIRDRQADVAFTLADTLADAAHGSGAFAGAAVPVRSIASLYLNYVHLVTLEGAGLRALDGLRGRNVSTGQPGSGTEVTALRILRASGLDPDRDLRRQALNPSQSADALRDGKLDAFFWSGGLPTPALQDLAHSPGVRMRLLPNAGVIPALVAAHGPLYTRLEIPAGSYPGVERPVPVVGVANLLVVREDMPEALAYRLTRVLFERQPELAAIHPEARKLSLDSATKGSPIEFHPGAQRYYREKGVR
jgi:hypothetical protein